MSKLNFEKLDKWADLLLDTGKRNNLINFKDSKTGAVEIVFPDFDTLFARTEHASKLEVFDPALNDEEEVEEQSVVEETDLSQDEQLNTEEKVFSKDEYIRLFAQRIKKKGQILIYNASVNPIRALRNIGKRAKTAIEETGVNIAYMAFGFIRWFEKDNPQVILRAPVLLVPISIEHDSALDPYNIKITDSDIIVNPTFSFKLKNDFGVELPEYEEESVEEYLTKVQELFSKFKWEVTKECKIGIFSFLKINMHKDLKDNAEKILQNRSVRALLGEDVSSTEESDGDKTMAEKQSLYCVVDADSSQTEAIEMAREGKSFVLQGPPGTGKSQTITNIIAECLACGKKVLFVSEKLAALNIVYDNLKKVGLEEFCLELHSHKANKKEVIAELCRTLKTQKSALSNRAQTEIEIGLRARNELNEYVAELHKFRSGINSTLYNLFEDVSSCRTLPDVEFVINDIKSKGDDYLKKAEIALKRYAEYVSSVGSDYRKNVWFGYSDTKYSYQDAFQLKLDLKETITLCDNITQLNNTLAEKYAVSAQNIYQAYALKEFFDLAKTSEFITPSLLVSSTLLKVLNTVKAMGILAKEILHNKQILDGRFDEDIYNLDGATIYRKLTKQFNGFLSRIFSIEYKRIGKSFKLCNRDGKKIKYQEAVSSAEVLSVYQRKTAEFERLEKSVKNFLGTAYNGVFTNFEEVISQLEKLAEIHSSKVAFGRLSSLSREEFVAKQSEFNEMFFLFEKAFGKHEEAEKRVFAKFDLKEFDVRKVAVESLAKKYRGCIADIDKLDNWCEFVKLLNNICELDLRTFVDYSIDKKFKAEDVFPTFKKTFFVQWIDVVLHESPVLIRLSRISHDETVRLFKAKDEQTFEINKAKIKAKLSAMRPNLDMVAQGSAIAVLLRENEKKRKQKGIRRLLDEIGDLAQTLKPCFLMSPLSVSTFLGSNIKFDVVVFDEASQIFPQDAIGAIYRGKQLIVVGDSKQMPPSNFFNSSAVQDDNDDETDDITDFESILDICSTAFPQKRLKWHYRSRFESLISFSNKNFYDNDLVTFPSSKKDAKGIGVDYFHVNGIFDRKTKTNFVEAVKIVDLVFENIEKYPERSLGVVAFSISQQNLIDKLLAKRRQQDPSKESFFRSDKTEPFFVKNLETVQGDERDTVIFSIAYGKDSQGRLLLNFGPVNREGGERRLNVAVTRAKYNIQVVASMHGTDIDLSRTQSVGARLLREYLDYAENGEVALQRSAVENPFANDHSDFEREICEFLEENGFCVDRQVGCSSFKIDLALKKKNSSDYLMAIECDGNTYRSSKNARDRDRLRQQILEKMGWKYYRVWSTDWFRNKRVEKERLLTAVNAAFQEDSANAVESKSEEEVSFEEVAQETHFEFPEYVMADEHFLARQHRKSALKVICSMVETESPLSEEWLLKRIVFLFDREKVTNAVRKEFNYVMRNCSLYKISRKDGFLYFSKKEIPLLRVPSKNASVIRDIRYISLEELALGMKAILKQNISVEKSGLFRLLVQQLGFSRMGEAISKRLEDALSSISNDIEINGDIVSLKR